MRRTHALVLAGVAISLAGCTYRSADFTLKADFQQAPADFGQGPEAPAVTKTVVETRNGRVEVRCDPTAREVTVTGTKYASAATPAAARDLLDRITIHVERQAADAGVLRIAAEFPPEPNLNAGASFRIILPAKTALSIWTSNGSVEVNGAAGEVGIVTSNGSIRVEGVDGLVQARSSNGAVELLNVNGNTDAVSSNGRIVLRNVGHGDVHARTSNGGIEAADLHGASRLETCNGGIRLAGADGVVVATTTCGGISLSDVAHDVTAVTSNGGIELERVGRNKVEARTSNARIRAVDTRGTLRLDSSNGPIELRTRTLPAEPDVHVATSCGSVRVELPASVRAGVHLRTSNARIRTDLAAAGISDLRTDRDSVRSQLNGGGGGRIEVTTSNGTVDFTLIDVAP
jgi:DUF4097 and DUF4098 domain-containing protein YvlB